MGGDLRATFTGRIVDGAGNPVPDAHVFFDNTVPGAPSFVAGLVTLLDENQNGVPDGLVPALPGAPLPTTHVVSAPDGTFTVKLQPLLAVPSVYTGRVQAPNRGTVSFAVPAVAPGTIGVTTPLGDIALSNTGTLAFTVNDLGTGATSPAKITIVGADEGTASPDFGSQYLSVRNYSGLTVDTVTEGNSDQLAETFVGTPALNFHVDADGVGTLDLAPGNYIAFASRGLEYTIDAVPFSIAAGNVSNVVLGIERVVDTSGFVSMDFHIHSTNSFDSSVPRTDRTLAFLASGVEVMVSTEHDYMSDYAPIIASLGVGDEITSIVGNELTGGIPVPAGPFQDGTAFPEGIGHWNAWPLSTISGNRRNGAPQDEFITPGTAIDRLRGMDSLALVGATPDTATVADWLPAIQAGQPGTVGALLPPDEEVVMLNHPRAGFAGTVVIGLFNGLGNPGGNPMVGGYDPNLPIEAPPNNLMLTPSLYSKALVGPAGTDTRAIDFDAIEVMNGSGVGAFLRVREDWCSLLDQGIHVTGTGVSDSHRLILENAGYARSFVASSTDAPALLDEDELTENVRAGQLTGTTGPFVRFSIEDDALVDVGLGGTAVATGERVTLKIRVEAAPWIPVEEVRIYRNCELVETRAVQSSKVLDKVLRFNRAIPLAGVDADSYFHVEAGIRLNEFGDPVSPGLLKTVQTIEPGVEPLAFTNPIFVDRDGLGYEAPGL
jgi:anti-anti-sigma regulatory factor